MEQTATESSGLMDAAAQQTTTDTSADQSQAQQSTGQTQTQQAQQQTQAVDTSWTLDVKAYGEDVSEAFINGYADLAKEVGLDQSKAGSLLGKVLEVANRVEAQENAARAAEWANELRNDPKFGGEMFDANLNIAKSALKQFGSPALVNVLNETGLGNNPDVIRFFWAVGKTIQEDSVVTGTTARSDADIARRMFPTMNQ